jgi:hypothetical protein
MSARLGDIVHVLKRDASEWEAAIVTRENEDGTVHLRTVPWHNPTENVLNATQGDQPGQWRHKPPAAESEPVKTEEPADG